MMSLPPFHRPNMSGQGISPSQPTVPAPPAGATYKKLQNDLGKVDRELAALLTQAKKGSPFAKAIEEIEREVKGLIEDVKSGREEDLTAALRRLEEELKDVKKEGKEVLSEKEKKALDGVQGDVTAIFQQLASSQELHVEAVKGKEGVGSLDTHKEVSKTIVLIQKMVEQIHVGKVGETTFTSVDMKNTTEVPSYFMNANLTITPDATGKMTIHFSNMTAEQITAAIAAIEKHPELLLTLLDRVSVNRLQLGEHVITLPQAESEQGRGEEGGGRGGGQGQEGRDEEEKGR